MHGNIPDQLGPGMAIRKKRNWKCVIYFFSIMVVQASDLMCSLSCLSVSFYLQRILPLRTLLALRSQRSS